MIKYQTREGKRGRELQCISCKKWKLESARNFPESTSNRQKFRTKCFHCLEQAEAERLRKRAEYEKQEGFVYFVLFRDYGGECVIKIGWTTNLRNRLAAYGDRGRLLGVFYGVGSDEYHTLNLFEHHLHHAKEWFVMNEEILSFVELFTQMPESSQELGTIQPISVNDVWVLAHATPLMSQLEMADIDARNKAWHGILTVLEAEENKRSAS